MNKCFNCNIDRELIPVEMDGEVIYLCPMCWCEYIDGKDELITRDARLRNPTPSGHTQGDML